MAPPARRGPGRIDALVKRIGIGLIRLYRIVFAWLPSSCRFYPTCSQYTEQAIQKYGLLRGSWMGASSSGSGPAGGARRPRRGR